MQMIVGKDGKEKLAQAWMSVGMRKQEKPTAEIVVVNPSRRAVMLGSTEILKVLYVDGCGKICDHVQTQMEGFSGGPPIGFDVPSIGGVARFNNGIRKEDDGPVLATEMSRGNWFGQTELKNNGEDRAELGNAILSP